MLVFYNIGKMDNEIQLTKNKMDLNNRKMLSHPPSPKEDGKNKEWIYMERGEKGTVKRC